jgi:hypothetical protein
MHAERGDDVVILNGVAARQHPPGHVVEAYVQKYEVPQPDPEGFWLMEVHDALAWQGHLGKRQENATRFVADQAATGTALCKPNARR